MFWYFSLQQLLFYTSAFGITDLPTSPTFLFSQPSKFQEHGLCFFTFVTSSARGLPGFSSQENAPAFLVQSPLLWPGCFPGSSLWVLFPSDLPEQTLLFSDFYGSFCQGVLPTSPLGHFVYFFSGPLLILKTHPSLSQSLSFTIWIFLDSCGKSLSFTEIIEMTTVRGTFRTKEHSCLWKLFLIFFYKEKPVQTASLCFVTSTTSTIN